jgi:hypothetical protein
MCFQSDEEINKSKAREITFIGSENAVKRIFNKMIDAGTIKKILWAPTFQDRLSPGQEFSRKTGNTQVVEIRTAPPARQ